MKLKAKYYKLESTSYQLPPEHSFDLSGWAVGWLRTPTALSRDSPWSLEVTHPSWYFRMSQACTEFFTPKIQCPLYIATLDIVAALPIATSSPVTNLRQYINSDLAYNDLKISVFCTKIATVNSFEVAISNALSFYRLNFTFYYRMSFGNSDRAAYSDLKPCDEPPSVHK